MGDDVVRINSRAIAATIMTVASDRDTIRAYLKAFRPLALHHKRLFLGIVAFLHCCSLLWARSKGDQRIAAACAAAADLIPVLFQDADRFVRIGEYVGVDFELSKAPIVLETEFHQRVPISIGNRHQNFQSIRDDIFQSVRDYEVHFPILVKMVLSLHHEQFWKALERTSDEKDAEVTFMTLATVFDEQVSGITSLDTADDPEMETARTMRFVDGAPVLFDSFSALAARLEALL